MPRWSCRATCQAGAATCSGVGSPPEPFQLCTLPQRTQIHPCGDGSGWHRRDLGAEGGAVTPAPAQWPWWLREGCGATSLCNRQSWCDHAMPGRHGHVPCLCVALPWAWICPTHHSPCGLPVPHLPWLSSTLVPLPLGALHGHRQRGHAVTPQRPCPAMGEDRRAAREAPQSLTVPSTGCHPPGTLTSPWGEAGEAICRALSLGAGVLLTVPS